MPSESEFSQLLNNKKNSSIKIYDKTLIPKFLVHIDLSKLVPIYLMSVYITAHKISEKSQNWFKNIVSGYKCTNPTFAMVR